LRGEEQGRPKIVLKSRPKDEMDKGRIILPASKNESLRGVLRAGKRVDK
jgi:hypothetical protein